MQSSSLGKQGRGWRLNLPFTLLKFQGFVCLGQKKRKSLGGKISDILLMVQSWWRNWGVACWGKLEHFNVRGANLMRERRPAFTKHRAPVFTHCLSVISLCKETLMHSCLGQSTWHLSTDPNDILFVPSSSASSLILNHWTLRLFSLTLRMIKSHAGSFFPLHHSGRLWGAAGLSSALWPVVYCWGDQLGTWMWAKRFSRGLHSCDVHQELDIHIPAFLKSPKRSWTGKKNRDTSAALYCTRTQVMF